MGAPPGLATPPGSTRGIALTSSSTSGRRTGGSTSGPRNHHRQHARHSPHRQQYLGQAHRWEHLRASQHHRQHARHSPHRQQHLGPGGDGRDYFRQVRRRSRHRPRRRTILPGVLLFDLQQLVDGESVIDAGRDRGDAVQDPPARNRLVRARGGDGLADRVAGFTDQALPASAHRSSVPGDAPGARSTTATRCRSRGRSPPRSSCAGS